MRQNAALPRNLGKKLQKQRKMLGLTQEDLADRVKLTRAYIGYIEQGRNLPSLETLEKITRVLKMRLSGLF